MPSAFERPGKTPARHEHSLCPLQAVPGGHQKHDMLASLTKEGHRTVGMPLSLWRYMTSGVARNAQVPMILDIQSVILDGFCKEKKVRCQEFQSMAD